MINNREQLLEEIDVFDTKAWPFNVKMKAKENKNMPCEEIEKMYKELCKVLVKDENWEVDKRNNQPEIVKEKVWEMLEFLVK